LWAEGTRGEAPAGGGARAAAVTPNGAAQQRLHRSGEGNGVRSFGAHLAKRLIVRKDLRQTKSGNKHNSHLILSNTPHSRSPITITTTTPAALAGLSELTYACLAAADEFNWRMKLM
jgi:hypothetical protein